MSDGHIPGHGGGAARVVLATRVSLLVRVWKEPREGEDRPEVWRASITDLGSGVVRYADTLASLIATIVDCGGIPLGAPQVEPGPGPRQ